LRWNKVLIESSTNSPNDSGPVHRPNCTGECWTDIAVHNGGWRCSIAKTGVAASFWPRIARILSETKMRVLLVSRWLHSTRPSTTSLMAGQAFDSLRWLTAGESKGFFVYILRCADGSLYVGHTSNIDKRVKVHNEGRGAIWTASHRAVTLVYQELMPSEESAIARERQVKRWTQAKKLALINGDQTALKT
jgi:putative endonuclease